MGRAPINAIVFPYRRKGDRHEFAIFNRADCEEDFWQGISGGAEGDETPMQTAKRESWEEGGISSTAKFSMLDSRATMPASVFRDTDWADDVYVVHEFAFSVDATDHDIQLSDEHTEFRWVDHDQALSLLKHQSNQNALVELNLRLLRNDV